MNTTPYFQREYLTTLQAIGDGLKAINKPLDADQSRVIAEVLAQRDAKDAEVDSACMRLDQLRHERRPACRLKSSGGRVTGAS